MPPRGGDAIRILTFVTQALDAEETIRIRDGAVDLSSSKLVLDTMDEYGVEEALRLREAGADAEIVALAVGAATAETALRSALNMGADRAIHVTTDDALDVLAVGAIVAAVAREENAGLLFSGGQQASWDSQALGAVAAEHLGWPQVTWVNALELDAGGLREGVLRGRHDVDSGTESFEVRLPAVLTTQQGLNEPRYPTVPNIIKSKKKELRQVPAARFAPAATVRTLSAAMASRERLRKMLDGRDAPAAAAQLVDFLRNQARVIA